MEDKKYPVINYKVYFYGATNEPEIRCLAIDQVLCHDYYYLSEKISALFPILLDVPFTIYWKDREGDRIRIGSDDELLIALCEMDSDEFKKIYIYPARLLGMNFNNGDQGDDYQRRREALRPMFGEFSRPISSSGFRSFPVLTDDYVRPVRILPPPLNPVEPSNANGRNPANTASTPQAQAVNTSENSAEQSDTRPRAPVTTLTPVPLSRLLDPEPGPHEVTVRYGYMGDPQQQYPVYIIPPSPQDDISVLDNSWAIVNEGLDDSLAYDPQSSYPSLSSILPPAQQKYHDAERVYPQPSVSQDDIILSPVDETMMRLQLLGFQNEDWLRTIVVNKNGNMNEVLEFLSPFIKPSPDH